MAFVELYITGATASILLNLIVILVLPRKKRKINYMDIITISLSTCDILKAIFGYSLEIDGSIRHHSIKHQECFISGFSMTFLGLVSISHLVGIALQRCAILRFPLKARIWKSQPTIAWYVIVPSWFYGLIWALLPLFGWSTYRPFYEGSHLCGPDLEYDKTPEIFGVPVGVPVVTQNPHMVAASVSNEGYAASYLMSLVVFCFVLPLFIIIGCSYSIYRSFKGMRREGVTLGLTPAIILQRRKQERKQCIMGGVMIGSFLISWSPFCICVFVLGLGKTVPTHLILVSAMLGKSSSLFNPIIYYLLVHPFRTACNDILPLNQFITLMKATTRTYRRVNDIFYNLYQLQRLSNNSERSTEDIPCEILLPTRLQENNPYRSKEPYKSRYRTISSRHTKSMTYQNSEYFTSLMNSQDRIHNHKTRLMRKRSSRKVVPIYNRTQSCPAHSTYQFF